MVRRGTLQVLEHRLGDGLVDPGFRSCRPVVAPWTAGKEQPFVTALELTLEQLDVELGATLRTNQRFFDAHRPVSHGHSSLHPYPSAPPLTNAN